MKALDQWNDLRPDLRYRRAAELTAHIMNIIGPFICEHGEARGHLDANQALMDAFHSAGIEVVTDDVRSRAGLPARDAKGWTDQELRILEATRIEAMLKPFPPLVMAPDPTRSPQG